MRIPIMFLGGVLDHAVRLVDAHPEDSSRPDRDHILAHGDEPREIQNYTLRKITSGPYRWWVYVCEAHVPSKRHLLDSAPTAVFKEAP